jgi:tRNA threonylcarbamoyladenosine biosynthesis protein TsaB
MPLPQRILAIDTSGAACSAALWRRGGIAARRYQAMMHGHAEALVPMIVEMLDEAAESFRAIDAVAVTVGPGAFTGIRIGLATARGIGLAAGIPVVGITTFAAVAQSISKPEINGRGALVLLDSRRNDVFAQLFSPQLAELGNAMILKPGDVSHVITASRLVVAGDGIALVRPFFEASGTEVIFSAANGPVDAVCVAMRAAVALAQGGGLPPRPIYLRAPEARLPSAAEATGDRTNSPADK